MSNKPLLPSYVIFSIGFYLRLCYSIGFDFSKAVNSILDFRVSAKRINEFLLLEELKVPEISKGGTEKVKLDSFSFSWNKVSL